MNPDAGSNGAPLDYTWEIRRLRKFQVQLVVIQENKLLRQAGEVFPPKKMRQWEEHFAMGHGETEAFLKDLESFESINRLLDVAESRRTAVLNEIADYRKYFALGSSGEVGLTASWSVRAFPRRFQQTKKPPELTSAMHR
jgi:hypothetical protein